MSGFNWDDHPVVAPSKSGAKGFSWDDHPIIKPAEKGWLDTELPGGTARGYIKGALNALPAAGAIAGGIVGTPADIVTGPAGTIVGAGVGGGLGTTLKNMGEQYILGEQKRPGEVLKDIALSVPESAAAEVGGQLIGKGLQYAAKSPIGQTVIRKAGEGAAKIGSLLTGVPEQEIVTYAKNADKVNAMSQAAGHDLQTAADQVRGKFSSDIQSTRRAMNDQISKSLEARAHQSIDSQPIIDALNSQKARLNPKLRVNEIGQIDDMIAQVKSVSQDSKIPLKDAQDLKEILADTAQPAYQPGMFQAGKKAQQAAKSGAAVARQAIAEQAPEVASANDTLYQLRQISKNANKNLFTPEKPAAALVTAGSGANSQNVSMLRKLGDATGTDMLGDAQNLAAMKTFGNPQLSPLDSTGKAVGRTLFGAGVGYAADGKRGAAIGAALSSPAALKVAINSGRAAGGVSRVLLDNAGALGQVVKPTLDRGGPSDQQAPPLNDIQPTEKPLKGKDKWANDGLQKLESHGLDIGDVQAAIGNPKIKDLLVKASDLKPGSKAMERIASQIKNMVGEQ